jgi:aryl-alcohol dehydrogenase
MENHQYLEWHWRPRAREDNHVRVSSIPILGAIAQEGGRYAIEPIALGTLQPGEVRIRVLASGMCRTDAEAFHMVPLPAVLGHEAVGDVIEVREPAGDIRVGDRVAVSYPSCGACHACDSGRLWLCESNWALSFDGCRHDGSRPITWRGDAVSSAFFQQSSFATEAIVPARSLVTVPADVPVDVIAALPCGLLTGSGAVTNVLAVPPGGTCAVLGTGAVGLAAIMTSRICRAESIIAIDIHEERLQLSRELGATHAFNASAPDVVEQIRRSFPDGIPHILDTTGSPQGWELGLGQMARGGTFAFVTTPEPVETYRISPFDVFLKAASMKSVLLGAANPRDHIPRMLQWWADGTFPIERLVRSYTLSDINIAAEDSAAGRTIKPIIVMPDPSEGGPRA